MSTVFEVLSKITSETIREMRECWEIGTRRAPTPTRFRDLRFVVVGGFDKAPIHERLAQLVTDRLPHDVAPCARFLPSGASGQEVRSVTRGEVDWAGLTEQEIKQLVRHGVAEHDAIALRDQSGEEKD